MGFTPPEAVAETAQHPPLSFVVDYEGSGETQPVIPLSMIEIPFEDQPEGRARLHDQGLGFSVETEIIIPAEIDNDFLFVATSSDGQVQTLDLFGSPDDLAVKVPSKKREGKQIDNIRATSFTLQDLPERVVNQTISSKKIVVRGFEGYAYDFSFDQPENSEDTRVNIGLSRDLSLAIVGADVRLAVQFLEQNDNTYEMAIYLERVEDYTDHMTSA